MLNKWVFNTSKKDIVSFDWCMSSMHSAVTFKLNIFPILIRSSFNRGNRSAEICLRLAKLIISENSLKGFDRLFNNLAHVASKVSGTMDIVESHVHGVLKDCADAIDVVIVRFCHNK